MKVLSLLVIFTLLLPLSSQAQWNLFGASKKVDLKCENLRDIKKGFLIAHINTSKMTPTLEARTVKQHLESLDPMKIFFSQADINMLTKKIKNIYKRIDKGNCTTLFEVKEHYTKRVKDRVKFAKNC